MTYYTDKVIKEILDAVENPQYRVWKCIYKDGRCKQNKRKIHNINDFKTEFLTHEEPTHVYNSIAQFKNPEMVYGKRPKKAEWVVTNSLFMKSDMLFDIDHEDINVAKENTIKILDWMKDKPYELINIRFSGTKGFHLLYRDLDPLTEYDPRKRANRYKNKRLKLMKNCPIEIDQLHKEVWSDQFRVHASIGSYKAYSGNKVELVKDLTTYKPHRVVRPLKADDAIISAMGLTSVPKAEGSTLTSSFTFIDNVVRGTKQQYITVLKFKKGKRVNIKRIQEIYNLSHFFKFTYGNTDIYINLKVVSGRRLQKIMRKAKTRNLGSFLFFKHSWIPTDMQFKELIDSEYGLKDIHSRPHANYLNLKYPKMTGKEGNRLCKAMLYNTLGGNKNGN